MTSAENRHEGHDHTGHTGNDHEGHDNDAHEGHGHDNHSGHDHSGHAHDHAAELREASRRSLTIALVLNQIRIGRDRGDGVCVWRLGQ